MPKGESIRGDLTHKSAPEHLTKSEPQLLIDSNGTWVAEYHPNFLRRGKKPYLEVSPAGMAMLDHIVVTFIPVEVERRRAGG